MFIKKMRGRKRINPDEKKYGVSISIQRKLIDDLEWIAVKKYNFVTNRGTANISKLIRVLIIKELKKNKVNYGKKENEYIE